MITLSLLGGGSTTDKAGTKQSSYTLPNGITATWAGGDKTLEGDIVSFGAEGAMNVSLKTSL